MAEQCDRDGPASGGPSLKTVGAEAKVEEWAGRWWEVMRGVALRLLEDQDVAEDVVQLAFMRALTKARANPDALERIRSPRAWLLKTTANVARGVLRTAARRDGLRRKNEDEIRENLFPDPDTRGENGPRTERVLEAAQRVLTKRQLEGHRMEAIQVLREHMSRGG